MKHQKERNINEKSNLNEVSKRKKYKPTYKLKVKKKFLLKKKVTEKKLKIIVMEKKFVTLLLGNRWCKINFYPKKKN